MITFIIVAGLLGTISILAMVWVWVGVLAGWREASPVRSLVMLWLLLLLMVIWGLGVDADYGIFRLLELILWPLAILYLLKAALVAKLFVFIFVAFILLFLVGLLVAIMPSYAKVPTIIVGAMLVVIVPVALQNLQVQRQMSRYAAASELRIIRLSSLFRSIQDNFDPHGVACDSENWPYLWSYRHRDWIALPANTRYGGDTKERVMSVCVHR